MKYTPQIIVEQKEFFSIPIYQRLFEWDKENIQTLLSDLKKAKENRDKEYYVGMITATDGENELVDGQQRFTVMMLFGCVMQYSDERWKSFLYDDKMRMHFSARPDDENYLRKIIESIDELESPGYNAKICRGIKCVKSFLDGMKEEERKSFSSYVYESLCFFITRLPKNYHARDLNKYFERMNSTGKNLAPHEILKIKLLRHLEKEEMGKFMQLWNLIADVDTPLIRRKDNEEDADLLGRKNRVLSGDIQSIVSMGSRLIDGMDGSDLSTRRSIMDLPASQVKPNNNRRMGTETRCVLRFPYLLLQTLYWRLGGKIDERIDDFFDASRLLETFDKYLPYEGNGVSEDDIMSFLQDLLHCRVALDVCFVRSMDYGFFLDMCKTDGNEDVKSLLMLESMLYVSSSNLSNYIWFGWLMNSLQKNGMRIPDPNDLFESLINLCDSENELPPDTALTFDDKVRYWFWRLDLYIWMNRKAFFKDNSAALKVADNYVFTRNRSIEHIAPQHPKTESAMTWNDSKEDETLRNSFGNLAMISQSVNSALSNESYEVKREHVKAFINGSVTGSIESLKLLVVFNDYPIWNRDTIKEHGALMYKWLEEATSHRS